MFNYLLSLPKTIYINFRCLPLRQAFHLPIWVHYRCKIKIRGVIRCEHPRFTCIRIGFHQVEHIRRQCSSLCVKKGATLVFRGTAHIGRGSQIIVYPNAEMILGNDFTISAASSLKCYKRICIGDNVLYSWDSLTMDSDTHKIFDTSQRCMNEDKAITIGNKVWIGCNSIILKGSNIPDNCIVGAGSIVSGSRFHENSIIAGNPGQVVKSFGRWEK